MVCGRSDRALRPSGRSLTRSPSPVERGGGGSFIVTRRACRRPAAVNLPLDDVLGKRRCAPSFSAKVAGRSRKRF